MSKYLFLFLRFAVLIPTLVSAIELNLDYPKFGTFDLNDPANQNIPSIIAYFYYFIVGIAGLAVFVMLIWGGVQWLTSGAIPAQASEAKDRIKSALLGLVLILASFLVIQVLNPELTIIKSPSLTNLSREALSNLGVSEDDNAPLGQTKRGIYLCDSTDCAGEFAYIDDTVLGCEAINDFKNIPDKCTPNTSWPTDKDWEDKVKSIRMNKLIRNRLGKDERVDAFWFEDKDQGGRIICFRGSVDNLDLYQLNFSSHRGWTDNISSMLTAFRRDFPCTNPGITLKEFGDLTHPQHADRKSVV